MTPDPDLARHFDAFHATHNLDTAHRTVLSYLDFEGARPVVEAARRSRAWAKETSKTVQAVSDYESAISDMIARDLVWEIDATKQSLISDYLDAAPALGPTEGIPDIGTLQFSIRFANLLDEFWAGIDCERSGLICCVDWQTEKLHFIYSPTRKGCLDFLRDGLSSDDDDTARIEHVSGPKPCGPWRCQWWLRYESGYVLEVHYL